MIYIQLGKYANYITFRYVLCPRCKKRVLKFRTIIESDSMCISCLYENLSELVHEAKVS